MAAPSSQSEPPFAGLLDNEANAQRQSAPAAPVVQRRSETITHIVSVCILGAVYIATSAGLIAFNKYLIHVDRFPYSAVLVLIHTLVSTVLCGLLFLCKPSIFPSLSDSEKKVNVDADLLLRGACPIAFCFSVQLVLSNTAYLHSSVAFLQMMKEANLVLVYLMSLLAALEKFSWRSCGVLTFVLIATSLTIHGELHFSLMGFTIQGSSQLFESCKIVLQGLLLSNCGRKLDPLTYVLLVMPVCLVFLGGFLSASALVAPSHKLLIPSRHELLVWGPTLALNACLAFALNVVIASFIKVSSPVAFILAGIVKDAMIVVAGSVLFEEIVTPLQTFGFTGQLCAVLLWSLLKSFPEKFQDGILPGMSKVLFSGIQEKAPLAPSSVKSYASNAPTAETC